MFIHGKIEHSSVNGPGDRAVIWTQGCYLKCPGCWNPKTHEFGKGTHVYHHELIDWLGGIEGIEGVTFSGGEPLQQGDMPEILKLIRKQLPTLSIGMFTGYAPEELTWNNWKPLATYLPADGFPDFFHGHPDFWERVKENLDWAVMGRYNQQFRTYSQPLRSSTNQKLILFSSFYKESDFDLPSCEITISPKGDLISVTGFPQAPEPLKELCA
jgi:anaerobic ribonucleoside-triphosphate reductase activating protein